LFGLGNHHGLIMKTKEMEGAFLARVDGQKCCNRAPYCGIMVTMVYRSIDYEVKWQIQDGKCQIITI